MSTCDATRVFLIVLCIMWNVRVVSGIIYADDEHSLNVTCTDVTPCHEISPYSSCRPQEHEDDWLCVCNAEDGFHSMNGICVLQASLGDHCEEDIAVCIDDQTVCGHDGHSAFRCICAPDTQLVMKTDESMACGILLTTAMDPNCESCIDNEGSCYDVTGDSIRDGCHCPASLSGENCEKIHVFVTCEDDTMHMCYDPHEGVNITAGGHIQVVDTHRPECRAIPADTTCGPGMFRLEVSLNDNTLDVCGTKKYQSDLHTVKYENMIAIYKTGEKNSDIILLKTFCSYNTHATGGFMMSATGKEVDGQAGQQTFPGLTLELKDVFEQTLPDRTALRSGDVISFWISLDTTLGYSSLSVQHCTMSSSPSLLDPKAQFAPITKDGCPPGNQNFLDQKNNWRRSAQTPHIVRTGNVRMNKFPVGFEVFLHCTVKVCLQNFAADCVQNTCDGDARNKRAADEELPETQEVELTHKIYFYDEESDALEKRSDAYVLHKTTFITIIAVILAVILIGLLAVGIGFYRNWRRRENVNHSAWTLKSRQATKVPPDASSIGHNLGYENKATVF